MKLVLLRLKSNQTIARDLWERNNFDWKNKEAQHFVMGETPWNTEVTDQRSNSCVTLPQVISPLSWPPSGSNGVFASLESCSAAEAWHDKVATCWGPRLDHLCEPGGSFVPSVVLGRSMGAGHTQSQHTCNPRRHKVACAHKHIVVCVQLEPPGVIGGHL